MPDRFPLSLSGLLLPCLVLFAWWPSEASAKTFGEIVVQQQDGFPAASNHGYRELRFRVLNRSVERSHTVRLGLVPQRSPYGAPGGGATVTAEVAAGGEAELRLYAHRGLGHRPMVTVEVDGRTAEGSPLAVTGTTQGAPRTNCSLLLSPSLPPASIPEPLQARCTPLSADLGVARWSDHWFAYTGFEGVALPEREWTAAPRPVRQALARFVESGGVVLLLGEHSTTPLPMRLRWGAPQGDVSMQRIEAGFGVLFQTPFTDPANLPGAKLERIFQALEEGMQPWRHMNNAGWAERTFPVLLPFTQTGEAAAGGGKRPERGLFLLLALFALGVGPGAMWWLKRRGRPIWILVVVPAAAVVTCGVLIAALLAIEGVEPRQRLDALTLLDQEGRHAVTLGRMALYAPFPPAALPFEAGTQVEPFVYHHWRNPQADRWTDWSRGQRLESGWLPPRVPLHLRLRRLESRRERLSVEWRTASGAVRVVNGLGAVVERLWLRAPDGRLFTAEGVAPGAAVELGELTESAEAASSGAVQGLAAGEARRWWIDPWVDLPSKVAAQAPGIVAPGAYVAVLQGSPFVEDPFPAAGTRRVRSVVYGWIGGGTP